MACYGCDRPFIDKVGLRWDAVSRSTFHSLCYGCMLEVLEVYDSTPEKRLKILRHIKEKGPYVPDSLIQDQLELLLDRFDDPLDRMFNPRG